MFRWHKIKSIGGSRAANVLGCDILLGFHLGLLIIRVAFRGVEMLGENQAAYR